MQNKKVNDFSIIGFNGSKAKILQNKFDFTNL